MSFLSNNPRLTQNGGLAPAYDSQSEQPFAKPPVAIESCIHDLIEQRCQEQPEASAVCAWDGEFTYRQLSNLSRSLGALLSAQGVAPEVFVPVYFEKSRWTVIAILGILHAGGAFVLLDPSHPFQRLESICQKVKAQLVITSSQNAPQAGRLASNVVVVNEKTVLEDHNSVRGADSYSKPNNAAYAMFTSGSTGTPKGVVIEHRSVSSWAVAYGPRVGLTHTSRALQFSSYAFDGCLMESFPVLIHGGCVCIPSEEERRSDLVAAMNRLRVNWAFLTPSMTRSLDPIRLPMLRTLACGGEAMAAQDRDQWASHLSLFNVYGPTECTVVTCVQAVPEAADLPIKIGYPVGGSYWIVDEDDVQSLCAVGQIGELLIEGPIVGRGYIKDEANTANSFIDRPEWLRNLWPSARGKVYRTGDLARCHPDGSIECLGRKDSQLRIRGQRMEAAEIEHHLRLHLPVKDAAVELIQAKDDPGTSLLAAFVVREIRNTCLSQTTNPEADLLASDEGFEILIQQVRSKMRQMFPGYMVPTVFLTLSSMPLMSISGKLDRRRLRQLGNPKSAENC